jgi:hypothetical protein
MSDVAESQATCEKRFEDLRLTNNHHHHHEKDVVAREDASDGGFFPFPIHQEMHLFDPSVLKGLSPA